MAKKKTPTSDGSQAEEGKKDVGRPSEYDDDYALQAEKLCMLGATDYELADFFGVSRTTVYRWKLEFPEFCNAIKSGKELADERVVRSLYQKATGYDFEEEQAVKYKVGGGKEDVKVVKVTRHTPADTTSAIFWLKNRRADVWRDVHKHEHGRPGDFDAMTDDQLDEFIGSESKAFASPRRTNGHAKH